MRLAITSVLLLATSGCVDASLRDPHDSDADLYTPRDIERSGRILVEPLEIAFPDTHTGQTETHRLTVRNAGFGPLLVERVELVNDRSGDFALRVIGDGALHSVPGVLDPQGGLVVEISYHASRAGKATGTVQVVTDDRRAPLTEVRVTGHAAVECLAVEPADIDFGPVRIGDRATQLVTLDNCGTVEVGLTSLAWRAGSSEDFDLILPPAQEVLLARDEVFGFHVEFAPTRVSPRLGAIEISTDLPGTKSLTLVVSGRGYSTKLRPAE